MSTCTRCPADIVWAKTSAGTWLALDAVPTVNGNIVLTWDPVARLNRATPTSHLTRSPLWRAAPHHTHHALTCPDPRARDAFHPKARPSRPDGLGRPVHPRPVVPVTPT